MAKKTSVSREVTREKKEQKAFANVLQATGLSQLKPIQPTRKVKAAPVKAKAKPKAKSASRKPSR